MDSKLIVYGHGFCPSAVRLRSLLNLNGIAYEWRDVAAGEPRFREELSLLARGYLSVPTVILPDGQVLVEPNPAEVLGRLTRTA